MSSLMESNLIIPSLDDDFEIFEYLLQQDLKPDEQQMVFELLQTKVNQMVAPRFESWRRPARFKLAWGGRGAGAKTWSASSLLVQRANREKIDVICLREIQKTLSESSHKIISNTINRLGYNGWKITDEKITCLRTGSYFIFRGLKDMRASQSVKGLEDFDIAFIDEASSVSYDSWIYLVPSLRKKGAEIWAVFNREEDQDPVYELYCLDPPKNSILLELLPGPLDNPWWYDTELEEDRLWWYKHDPDEAEHIYGGQPRKQGHKCVLSRIKIRAAMNRDLVDPEGKTVVGCDPADFGDDKTEIYVRKGMKVIDHCELHKMDGIFVANEINRMIKGDPSIQINIDSTGIGTSARDHCKALGLKVNAINFAEKASDEDNYSNITSEMWFTFPVDEADIPDDQELMRQLSGRRYGYDSKGRSIIEPKKDFKERYKKSPDKADALLLCYYNGSTLQMSEKQKEAMRRRRRGY